MRKLSLPWLSILGIVPLALVAAVGQAASQAGQHQHGEHHSPYAEQESSGIAALSRQEVEDLESGAGMGLARAAELNHYPGPKHVLELAEALSLSAEQHAEVERVHSDMLAEAQRVGAEIVEEERMLDKRFAHRHLDEPTLRRLTAEIAVLQGELRFVHLVAHLRLSTILTEDQVAAYDSLRGYEKSES